MADPGLLNRLSANPWIQFGTGMTGAPGRNQIQQLNNGLRGGLNNAAQYQQAQTQAQTEQLKYQQQQQALYEQLYQNAQRAAQQERASQYMMQLDPSHRPMAGAMGVPEHAAAMQEQIAQQQEMETYHTPRGPQQMPKIVGQRAGLIPYDVWLQSEEARRANTKLKHDGNAEARAQAEHEREAAEDRLKAQQAQLETARAAEDEYWRSTAKQDEYQTAIDALDRALPLADSMFAAGSITMQMLGSDGLPPAGTDAFDLYTTLLQAQSIIGLEELKDLKRTGATMGALNTREMDILISQMGSLDWRQDKHVLKKNIVEVQRLLRKAMQNGGRVVRRAQNDMRRTAGGGGNSGGFTYEGTE